MEAAAHPSARARAFVAFTLRYGRWLWLAALLLAVPAAIRTAGMYANLRSEVERLLPRQAPSVLAIDELRARMPGLQHLGVVVDSGDAARLPAAERLLDDLAAKVRAYPPGMVRAIRVGDEEERAFVEAHAPLYADVGDLREIQARIERRRDYDIAKESGNLIDESAPAPPLDFSDIEKKYETKTEGAARFEHGRFSSAEKHLSLLLIEVGEFSTGGQGKEADLFARVKSDLDALGGPERYAPGMRVGFSGDVAISVEETSALMADLSLSSVVVLVLEIVVMVVYFRWWKSIFILVPPLLLATVYAFALASLPPLRVTELNSNTAFLASIIIGNGINFGIILLARYVEERRAGVPVEEAMATAVWASRPGTLSAALAAAVSYASLIVTEFQGFRQFGFIGGLGMVLGWVLAYVLVPSLAAWLDRGIAPRRRRAPVMRAAARLASGHPRVVVAVAAVLAALAIWQVSRFRASSEIETDFSKLRRADTWEKGEGYWGAKMDDLLGTYLTPTVILTDDRAQAAAIGAALRKGAESPPLDAMIASIRTIDDLVPSEQAAKVDVVAAIKDDLSPKIRSAVDPKKLEKLDKLLGKGELRPVGPDDLPSTFTTGLRERDGSIGRAVLVYPKPSHDLWVGPPLADFVLRLREAAELRVTPDQRAGRVAGSLPLSSDILSSIRRDGAIASAAAFLGVVVVVILLFRLGGTTLWVTGSLVLGVLWLAGAMMALRVRINFANFIAFPITFGIGVDYAVNIMSRYRLEPKKDLRAIVETTGGAVTLCSLTTIIGYSSLLMAENRALFLFGLVAVLGEVCCLSAAILVLPAALTWWGERRRAPKHG